MFKNLMYIFIFFQAITLNGQMVSLSHLNSALKKTLEALPASNLFADRMQAFVNTYCTSNKQDRYNLTLNDLPNRASTEQLLIEINKQGLFSSTFKQKHLLSFYTHQEAEIKHWYFNATDGDDYDIFNARIAEDGQTAELLKLKSSKLLNGTTLLKLWDDLCTLLRPTIGYIWDDSMISDMNLRILRLLVSQDRLAWYAAYGYRAVTKKNQEPACYEQAKEYLIALPLRTALEVVQKRWKNDAKFVVEEARSIAALPDTATLGEVFRALYTLDKTNPVIRKLFIFFISYITRAGIDDKLLLHDYSVENYPEFLKLRCSLNILIKTIYFKKNYDVSATVEQCDPDEPQVPADYFQDEVNLAVLVNQCCSKNTVKSLNQALRYMLAAPKQFTYEQWIATIKNLLNKNEVKNIPDYLLIEQVLTYFASFEPAKWCYGMELSDCMSANLQIVETLIEFLITPSEQQKEVISGFAKSRLVTIAINALKRLIVVTKNTQAMYLTGKLLVYGPSSIENNNIGLALLDASRKYGNIDAALCIAGFNIKKIDNAELYTELTMITFNILLSVLDAATISESQREKAYLMLSDLLITAFDFGCEIPEQQKVCQSLLAYFNGKIIRNTTLIFALGLCHYYTGNIDKFWKTIKKIQESLMFVERTEYLPLFKAVYEFYWSMDHCAEINQEHYDFIFKSCYKELSSKLQDSQYAAFIMIDMFNNGHIAVYNKKAKKALMGSMQNIISPTIAYENLLDRQYAQKLKVILDANNFELAAVTE